MPLQTITPATKKPDPKALLLIGPPGGGKSSLMLRLQNIGVIDVDTNLDGPLRFLGPKVPGLSVVMDNPLFMSTGKPAAPDQVWPNTLMVVDQLVKHPDVKWIGVDGLTGLNFHLINFVTKRAGKTEMSQDLWIPFRQQLILFINTVRLAGKNYVMTCHEEVDADRDGKILRRKVSIDSKIKDFFGGWFTDVWRCTIETAPGSLTKAKVSVRSSAMDDLKTSSPEMPTDNFINYADPKFSFNDAILKYLL